MNNKISVLIVDDNKAIAKMLSLHIQSQKDMSVAGIAYNGEEALEFIPKKSPDVIILDLVMPRLDGLGVLKKLENMQLEKIPKIILYSVLEKGFEFAKSFAVNINIDYCLTKSLENESQDCEHICNAIRNIMPDKKIAPNGNFIYNGEVINLKVVISQILTNLGVPNRMLGYRYCRSAIVTIIQDPNMLNNITEELYPQLAKLYNSTPSRVERNIRAVIEKLWKQGNLLLLGGFYNKPTNKEFLSTIADRVKMRWKL